MDRTGVISLLILVILLVFLYTTGRLQASFSALAGRRELANNG